MRRIAATIALLAIALGSMSMAAMCFSSPDRPMCCKNPTTCPMHQHSPAAAQLDRCPADANHDVTPIAAVRAVIGAFVFVAPDFAQREFVNTLTMPHSLVADDPQPPPPRFA